MSNRTGHPPFLRFSMKKDNLTWYAVVNEAVVEQSTPAYLTPEPVKWDETTLGWQRNMTYWGIGRTFSTPYEMALDAARILKYVFYTYGSEGPCTFLVDYRHQFDFLYDNFYTGEVDVSMAVDQLTTVAANIMEGGINSFIKSRETVPVEIPLLDADCIKVRMDGIKLLSSVNYVLPQQGITNDIAMATTPLVGLIGQEGALAGAGYSNTNTGIFLGAIGPNQSRAIYQSYLSETATLTVSSATFFAFWPSGATDTVKFTLAARVENYASNTQGGFQTIFQSPTGLAPGQSASYNVASAAINLTLVPQDYIVIYAFMINNSNQIVSSIASRFRVLNDTAKLQISTVSRNAESIVRAYRYIQVLQKAMLSLSDGQYTASSSFLNDSSIPRMQNWDNRPWNTVMFCGDAARGLGDGSTNPAKIRLTIKDAFDDLFFRYLVGVQETSSGLSLLPLSAILNNAYEIASIGNVASLKVSTAKDLKGSQLKVGQKSQTYDTLNGKDEFNQGQTRSLPFKREMDSLERVSAFRWDMYGIEATRANLSGKNTTDSSSDNDVFLVDINDTVTNGAYGLYRPTPGTANANSITGVLFPDTTYNISLSPGRDLNRQGPLNAAILYQREGEAIKFQTADKNADLQSDLGSGLVIENADLPVDNLPPPLFKPIYFDFDCPPPRDLFQRMESNPNGYFTFIWNDITLRGFPITIGQNPATNGKFSWRLLCCPDVDLTPLMQL